MPCRPSRLRRLAELFDVLGGEAGQRLAVVELQLLHQRQAVLLRLLEPRQHRPHRGDFDRVRSDVLARRVSGCSPSRRS
jgi:hypothetical protein